MTFPCFFPKNKIAAALLSASSVFTLFNAVHASEATPEDNQRLRNEMAFLTGALDVSIIAGLIPFDPVSRPGEILEFGLNLGLKALPPVLELPGAVKYNPNTNDGCHRVFHLPQTTDQYDNWFGFWEIEKLSESWGDLGTPRVYHSNTSVELSVSIDGDLDSKATRVSLPAGKHNALWQADTQISPFWDVGLPLFLMLPNGSAEAKYGEGVVKKAAKANAKKASKVKKALVQAAERIAKSAGLQVASLLSNGIFDDSETTVSNRGTQSLTVFDIHTPILTTNAPEITVEARNFGGSFFSRVEPDLLETLTYYDECDRPVTLRSEAPNFLPFGKSTVTWTVSDGDSYLPGIAPTKTISQIVDVQDTQAPILVPPAGFALYSDVDIDLNKEKMFLGSPLVVDLADPTPSVERDAPDLLKPGFRYLVNYTAIDDSGNATQAPQLDPNKYSQTVSIKLPGTNTAPSALEKTASTLTSSPVAITLQGIDIDELPFANSTETGFDPLEFIIVDRPERGEFVAPLYPYFIEDFRLQPEDVITGEVDYRTLACPVDPANSQSLEAKLGLLERENHNEYIERCYCLAKPRQLPIPEGFIYQPRYIHVTDDNEYYVSDSSWYCTNSPKGSTDPRIAKFVDGELVAQVQDAEAGFDGVFQMDDEKNIWYTKLVGSGSSKHAFINGFDKDLNRLDEGPASSKYQNSTLNIQDHGLRIFNGSLVNTHVDSKRKVIYVNDKRRIYMFDYDDPDKYLGVVKDGEEFLRNCGEFIGATNGGFWMDTDSQGNLYQVCRSKIHKIGPPKTINGKKVIGDYIGWMGKCTANKLDPKTQVPYNFCDEETQTSKGFQCSDETCDRPVSSDDQAGDGPGQFNRAAHLDVDVNDVLYVVDFGNSRIQRFSPDGTFAGEAKSTGDGVTTDGSFVLGNMGMPRHVSVNAKEFHVLEANSSNAEYFLHIFKTLPFYDVTDSSAKVDYISDFNFQGTDSFSYLVDDGIDTSNIATVEVQVDRAFRAPEKLVASCYTDDTYMQTQECTLNEDEELYIRLSSEDLDGFIGFGGLDRLTYSIEQSTENGELEFLNKQVSYQNLVYRPNKDYFGSDRFVFNVSDGVKSAEQSKQIDIQVIPVSDPVKIIFPEDIQVARGFAETFRFEFEDVDKDSFPQPEIFFINWGDGSYASDEEGWVGVGVEDENGDPVNPQYNTTAGNGIIVAAHSFDEDVSGIEVCMKDGVEGIVCHSSLAVDAVESTNVSINRMNDEDLEPNQDYSLKLLVINQKPDTWDGLKANSVSFNFDLESGLNAVSMDSRCQGVETISCSIDTMEVEEQEEIEIMLKASPGVAQQKQIFTMGIEITDQGPRLNEKTYTIASISVADDDNDETINYYDDFPLDARYTLDSDQDGIADIFEDKFGLDKNDASDALIDADGDGATALTEFLNDTSPYLPDAFSLVEVLSLDTNENTVGSDQFGVDTASGDINGDGFDDVIVSAPRYGEYGAAFVFLGSEEGMGKPIQLVPEWETTEFTPPTFYGKKVAAGDLNNDGFDDVAVASDYIVYVFWGSDDAKLEDHFKVSRPTQVPSFAHALLIQDADGDAHADLLLSSMFYEQDGQNGAVHVYLGAREFWLDGVILPNLTLYDFDFYNIGLGLAIGDLDGDLLPDIVASTRTGRAGVIAFFGNSIDWSNKEFTEPNVRINGLAEERFGYDVTTLQDFDGDAKDDIFVSAYNAELIGAVKVFSSSSNFSESAPLVSMGSQKGEQFSVGLSPFKMKSFSSEFALAVGANRKSLGDQVDNGFISVLTGSELDQEQFSYYGKEYEHLGYSITAGVDINNDGEADIIAGAPNFQLGEYEGGAGRVYIYFGGQSEKQSDEDADEVGDDIDNCLNMANSDQLNTDNDNFGNVCDADDDNDGVLDAADAFPLDASESVDTDGDGIGNNADTDDDGDGVLDVDDAYPLDPTRTRDDSAVVSKDVNGDGMADILWRNQSDGRNWMWTMDGRSILTSAGINTIADPAWQIVGRGDFDGDGKSDVLWRNSDTGRNWVYLMDGFTIRSSQQLNYVTDNNWHVKGVGDFDGDGKDDVIWRHAVRGDTWVYLMNGTQIRVSQGSRKVSDLNWKIVAVGDVDGDSKDDVIWRHATRGDNYIWLMNGVQLSSGYVLNRISTTWEITGAGDLNGDGTDDILWRNKVDGRNWGYLMNGGQIQTSQLINTVSSQDWQMADILDLDGDGKVDIFWRNNNDGRSYIFLMNGLSITSQGFSTSVSNNWQVIK